MGYEKLVVGSLVLILGAGLSSARAQATYNRWDARPVATPQTIQTKAQQDSARRVAYWQKNPPIKRGIGSRIRTRQLVPEDQPYFNFVGHSVRYPAAALRAQTEGEVWMRLSVDATGQVVRVTLLETTISPGAGGEAEVIQQTREILQCLRFEPSAAATEEEAIISFRIL
jgi:outer membrane biosynthesis protein TonB